MLIRVMIDTGVVRNHIHKSHSMLDLNAIHNSQDQLRISLSSSAMAELLEQICKSEGGITFSGWQEVIPIIDSILDKRWPFFPSGKQLSALTKVQTDSTIDLDFETLYMQACWHHLKSAKNVKDLQEPLLFSGPDGEQNEIRIDVADLENKMAEERQVWIEYVQDMQKKLPELGVTSSDEERVYNMIKCNQGSRPYDSPDMSNKLELVNRMIAKKVVESLKRKNTYNPNSEKRRSDNFDISLLYYIPLPAVICTTDEKLVRSLGSSKSLHSKQVICVDEFNRHVRNGTLGSLLSCFRTPEQQVREWRKNAYLRWINRGHPYGDDMADWFATEPIA